MQSRLLKYNDSIIRVLHEENDRCFIIDCVKRTMPVWRDIQFFSKYLPCSENELWELTSFRANNFSLYDAQDKKVAHERFTIIAPLLPFISNAEKRNDILNQISSAYSLSKQTIRHYLCNYLVYQDISALTPKSRVKKYELSQDEKNMRWALNKYFYTPKKNSLNVTYIHLLKEKYCDASGRLLDQYPSFYRFRYFYRKTRKMQNYYISRNGLKDYQKNHRPLLGDGIQEFAPTIGVGMLDATICDIYLVNDAGNVVGRPILTVCIDAYSSFCCGYSLSWEGGMYSLRGLMNNIIANKQKLCDHFGISINKDQWDIEQLPGVLVTDMGAEYKSETFEQITELGIMLINLPAYRPELKGSVEKFFDLIQNSYKPHLKGKGVIEPNFMQRGAHDYRKDACLTMNDFEKIVLQCIIFYNSKRILENFPFTDEMLRNKVKPYANAVWEWGKGQIGANLVTVDRQQLILTLLPRAKGKFSRNGLKVNNLRYKNEKYTEKFLHPHDVTVAYNPDDASRVWLIEESYIVFDLVQDRYRGKTLTEIGKMQSDTKNILKNEQHNVLQGKIDLIHSIDAIVASINKANDTQMKAIRQTRKAEQTRKHIDYMEDFYD